MKKALVLATAMLFVASAAMAQTIVNSAHDFSGDSWNTTGEICIVCHTPHNAISGAEPLWNHDLSTASYTPYASNTLTATDVAQPTAESKNCLACHDGTVALESFGGNGTGTGGGPLGPGNPINVGTDLSDDHPVSFTYDLSLANADGGLEDPTTALSGLAGGGTIAADMLFGGEMQCSSCHGVHNESGEANFLIMANTASALCLTCHTK